jgi:16S rRNA (cytidine1402-2'-O)-methyltransferase
VPVTVLPGPSAVETALVASGFGGEGYRFLGFLPRGEPALAELWASLRAADSPSVAFESPQRVAATVQSLAAAEPERRVAVCRELTKVHEEVLRGTAADVAARLGGRVRGEITLVIGPGSAGAAAVADVDAGADAVAQLVAEGVPRRRASEIVSRLTGTPRNELYRRTL